MNTVVLYLLAHMCNSNIVVNNSTIDSFNAFQPILPDETEGILYNLRLSDKCQPEYQPRYNNFNINATILSINLNENCRSYVSLIRDQLNGIINEIQVSGRYPQVKTVLINEFQDDREGIGKPTSGLGELFSKDNINRKLNWILVPYNPANKNILDDSNLKVINVANNVNPWIELFVYNKSTVAYLWFLKITKLILLVIEIVFIIYVIYLNPRSYIQIFLLFVGIQQLLGNFVLNWLSISSYVVKVFIILMLILCGVSNSIEIIAWSDIVAKINKQPLMRLFQLSIKIELIGLIISQLIWAVLLYLEQKSVNNPILAYLPLITFFVIVLVPLVIGVWFYLHAYYFVRIFSHYGKLIKAHKLTILIGLTRLGFMGVFTFSFLIASQSKSAMKYYCWITFNDLFMIIYNASIILTVIEILRLTKIRKGLSSENTQNDSNSNHDLENEK